MKEPPRRIPAADLARTCRALLQKAGVPEDQASLISDVVVEADLRGIGSHGVLRLPAYIHRVQAGTMTARTEVAVVRQRPAVVLLDAQHGFGQVAAAHAMQEALGRAETCGTCFIGVRNAGHFGIAAYFAMMALPRGMVGIVSANAAPSMAPWGGRAAQLGTNPICVAIPTGGDVDIVLDMASSVVARGKIRLAATTGKSIPLGWALDSDGRPTENPQSAMTGTLLPIGGPKGYGLALIVDVLAGVLTGSSFGVHVPSTDQLSEPPSSGFFVQALDIGAFADPLEFQQNLQQLIAEIRESPRAQGVERIFLPGEIEWRTKQERLEAGVPVPDTLRRDLVRLGGELGVEVDLE